MATVCDVMPIRKLNRLIALTVIKKFDIKKNIAFIELYKLYNKKNKGDKHSTRGLVKAVNQRKRLLDYLKNNNIESYKNIIAKLNLRK